MQNFWDACLRRLEQELPAQQFNTWIRPLALEAGEAEDALVLAAPNRFVLAHELEHETVRRSEHESVACLAVLEGERPNPGIELLRGQFLLEPTQAGVPEILHLVVGLDEARSYPLRHGLSTGKS